MTTYRCENDSYCPDTASFESVDEFLAYCQECFGDWNDAPELTLGADENGVAVYRDADGEIVLYEEERP